MKFKDLQNILQNLITNERITLEKIGNALGIQKASVSNRAKTDSELRPDEIAKIEKYFNVDLSSKPDWMYDDRGKFKKFIDNAFSPKYTPEDFREHADDIIEIEAIRGIHPECGSGCEVYAEPYIEPFRISRQSIISYLRCTSPENLKTFQASGDSMESTISHGDWLLVDVGYKDAYNSGVYVFLANGKYRCKRLNITLDGRLEVKSDNKNYQTEIVGPDSDVEIEIVGRVLNNLSRGI